MVGCEQRSEVKNNQAAATESESSLRDDSGVLYNFSTGNKVTKVIHSDY